MADSKAKMEKYCNRGKRGLPPLYPGMPVVVQNKESGRWDIIGLVQETHHIRRYMIRLTSGMLIQKNRRFVQRRYIDTHGAAPRDVQKDISRRDIPKASRQSEHLQPANLDLPPFHTILDTRISNGGVFEQSVHEDAQITIENRTERKPHTVPCNSPAPRRSGRVHKPTKRFNWKESDSDW